MFEHYLSDLYVIVGTLVVREIFSFLIKKVYGGNGYLTKLNFEQEKANFVFLRDYKEDMNKLDGRLKEIWEQVDYLVRLEIDKGKK